MPARFHNGSPAVKTSIRSGLYLETIGVCGSNRAVQGSERWVSGFAALAV